MTSTPIRDYALLSDCHSAALVSRDGSVDWLCFPRFDSASVLAALLGRRAGHWRLSPTEVEGVERSYVERSMVLETVFQCSKGRAVLREALVVPTTDDPHLLGAGAPHALVRVLECEQGAVEVEVDYRPRPEYGLTQPIMTAVEGGLRTRGGPDRLALSSPVPLEVEAATATGTFRLQAGDRAAFALQWARSADPPARIWTEEEVLEGLAGSIEAWNRWSHNHQRFEGPWRDLVDHSGRVLQALTYQPTGAMVAAATTSLPEVEGGERNWDYRYSWVRDASFTLEALWVAACPDEATRFFEWLVAAAAGDVSAGRALQIMFGVGGEHDLTERALTHLEGWRDSRPVRIGNGAWDQHQLDVYGELLTAVARLQEQLGELEPIFKRFIVALADEAAARWTEPDHGIWEVRGEPRHFLHSKLMCWAALDRAIAMAPALEVDGSRWADTRDEIAHAILERGFDDERGAFTQAFGSRLLDASALVIPIVGFLPPDDPRVEATVRAVEKDLVDEGGLVLRYQPETEDGLAGREGAFLLCTFWLVEVHALAGRMQRARDLFERAVSYRNDVDLLSEEVDERTGELLGNFPQAFSHIGLINAAWAIHQAEQKR